MKETEILIACIGNIFHGDDAFGVAVAQRLMTESWPPGVRVVDYGIRGIDLAFALLDEPAVTIFVDIMARGGAPGTLYLIEPNLDELGGDGEFFADTHGLDPLKVLRLAKSMGAQFHRILLVACEPLTLGDPDIGHLGLSEAVEAAIAPGCTMVRELVQEIQNQKVVLQAGACAQDREAR